jgi:hypothetical protein
MRIALVDAPDHPTMLRRISERLGKLLARIHKCATINDMMQSS